MEYKNVIKKWGEFVALFGILGLFDYSIGFEPDFVRPVILLGVILLFSLAYGWKMGALSICASILYMIVNAVVSGHDMLLLFLDMNEAKWFILYIFVWGFCGFYSTAMQEKKEDLKDEHEELYRTNKELEESINTLAESRRDLRQKILEFEHSPKVMYERLNQIEISGPDVVIENVINVVSQHFKTSEVGFYIIDNATKSLKLHMSSLDKEGLSESILLTEKSCFYQRVINERNVLMKQKHDEENDPMVAGPLIEDEDVFGILVIKRMHFDFLQPFELEMLQCILDWASHCLDMYTVMSEENNKRMLHHL
ncbi:hypothetical protein J2S78_002569 [Salibacterium salarium]|uniref:GAF domain-containing protein n=1 Tax=Salibacterium salarium TaxID=284579 RepID=UPI0027834E44|nr:GAF domain-containing protein [Salibacterium salarium]MDQ0300122.1 hypothetical protein [Salibacterium salarium]